MIQVTYAIPFTAGSNLATQLQEAQFAVLDQGELELLALVIANDVTAWSGSVIERQVQFTETPEFVARMGLPFTNAKRRSAVAGLFTTKLGRQVRKIVEETIQLF